MHACHYQISPLQWQCCPQQLHPCFPKQHTTHVKLELPIIVSIKEVCFNTHVHTAYWNGASYDRRVQM